MFYFKIILYILNNFWWNRWDPFNLSGDFRNEKSNQEYLSHEYSVQSVDWLMWGVIDEPTKKVRFYQKGVVIWQRFESKDWAMPVTGIKLKQFRRYVEIGRCKLHIFSDWEDTYIIRLIHILCWYSEPPLFV